MLKPHKKQYWGFYIVKTLMQRPKGSHYKSMVKPGLKVEGCTLLNSYYLQVLNVLKESKRYFRDMVQNPLSFYSFHKN